MDLEQAHTTRIQEFLSERRREKERDNQRARESALRTEESMASKERIYKERVKGLEEQVETLRDQLSKEIKRRQTLISSTGDINLEIHQLRTNLDESLRNVGDARYKSSSELRQTLDRETKRLIETSTDFDSRVRFSTPLKEDAARRKLSFESP